MRHVLLLILAACGGTHAEPVPVPAPPPSPSPAGEEGPIAGGWSSADPASDEIRAAAAQVQALLRERTGDDTLTIEAITEAKQQVVAGMNYELALDVVGKDGPRHATVVVYRDLQDHWSLTSVDGL